MSPRIEGSDDPSEIESDTLCASDGAVFSLLTGTEVACGKGTDTMQNQESDSVLSQVQNGSNAVNEDMVSNDQVETKDLDLEERKFVDSWTQTEEEYFDNTSNVLPHLPNTNASQVQHVSQNSTSVGSQAAQMYKLPLMESRQLVKDVTVSAGEKSNVQPTLRLCEVSGPNKMDTSQFVRFPSAKRPLSAFVDSLSQSAYHQKPNHTRSYSADAAATCYTPRTAEATKRLMGLYNGFSRTETMRKFHERYPEKAPDLREYSIREGKRHIIHGSHAYYFH